MSNICDLTISIVTYNNDPIVLLKTINSVLNSTIKCKLIIIDNSEVDDLKHFLIDYNLTYYKTNKNIGFGAAHNIAINKYATESRYHLILNPDITFDKNVLLYIKTFLDTNADVGVLMPKITYPNGVTQNLVKLSPNIFDLLIRRIAFLSKIFYKKLKKYELYDYNYDKIIDVPFLSGCFLFCRTEVLKKVEGFDKNIFLYMEDVDLTRRIIDTGYRSIVYPDIEIIHDHTFKKINNFKTFLIFFKAAFYYYNKWGWLIDKKRYNLNKNTLSQIN